jgi:hypothetical protein
VLLMRAANVATTRGLPAMLQADPGRGIAQAREPALSTPASRHFRRWQDRQSLFALIRYGSRCSCSRRRQ